MKFVLYLVLFSFLVVSCNLVELNNRRTTRKLNKATVQTYVFQKDSLHINYWKGGSGPVLVFVHGFGGDGMVAWEKELRHFAKTNTVIAYDLLWFGKSYSNAVPNLSAQTNALNSLLKDLKVEKASFIGQSYGGFVVMDFAYKFPEKVEKLIVANSPGPTFDIHYLDTVCANFGLDNIADLFVLNHPDNIQRLTNAITYSDLRVPKFLRRQMFAIFYDKNKKEQKQLMTSLPYEQQTMQDVSVFQAFPTLVLWGENDEIFPLKEGKKLAEAINAKFVAIPKCGHGPQIDQPKEFLRILNNFLLP